MADRETIREAVRFWSGGDQVGVSHRADGWSRHEAQVVADDGGYHVVYEIRDGDLSRPVIIDWWPL